MRRLLKLLFAFNALLGLAGLIARLLLTSRGGPDSDEIDLVSVFEGLHFRSHSSTFLGGSILAFLGGIVLDLRRAHLGPTGAHLRVTTIFGGTALIIPPDWRVEVTESTWMGGLDLSTHPPTDPDAPVLRLHILTFFGGTQVEARPRLQAVS